tara:strand:+ start:417 stop:962 length:546 start_codon:yes stop_codon:yes gene_type:complete
MAKKKKRKNIKKNKGKNKLSLKQWAIVLGIVVALIIFLPTTVVLAVGMLPTLVAAITDRYPGRNKTFTVGAMNFAGCFPYLLDVWIHTNSMNLALYLISQPKTIMIMYGAAALGYSVNAFVTFLVSAILVQKSEVRIKKIHKEKKALEERWGRSVNRDPDQAVSNDDFDEKPNETVEKALK